MIHLIKSIRTIVGKKAGTLVLPIVLSCMDSILNMGMFGIMITTIIQLVNQSFTLENLKWYSILLLVLFLLRCIINAINYTQAQFRGADITKELRLNLGDHIRSLNLGYFNKNSIGRLTSTLTTDIGDFETVLTHSIASFFKVIFFSALAIFFAFLIDWRYATIILVIVAVSLPLLNIGGKVAIKRSGHLRSAINEVVSRMVEYISGIKTFKLYHLTGEKFERLDKSFRELKKESIRMELSIMPYSISFSIITSWIIPIALVAGTWFLSGQQMGTDRFIAVIMIAISISSMMTTLGTLYPEMQFLSKASENILSVMAEKPFGYQKERIDLSHPDVEFHNVTFRYTDKVDVLKNISFTSKSGTTTALIGPSGSGKTTIVSLISRFWDVSGGSIHVDGTDIRTISPDGLTENMAVVFQDVYLLNDTLFNNIRVGKPNASREEVEAAAKAACCHDFIMQMPHGYDTVVGEGGSTLSGGERQRISIARAFIKDAPIVLLDETTSSLDADNEAEINKALDRLMKNKTVIVIAHRLNTILKADNILVLDKGNIREQGNHHQLLEEDGWYATMYQEQQKAKNWTV